MFAQPHCSFRVLQREDDLQSEHAAKLKKLEEEFKAKTAEVVQTPPVSSALPTPSGDKPSTTPDPTSSSAASVTSQTTDRPKAEPATAAAPVPATAAPAAPVVPAVDQPEQPSQPAPVVKEEPEEQPASPLVVVESSEPEVGAEQTCATQAAARRAGGDGAKEEEGQKDAVSEPEAEVPDPERRRADVGKEVEDGAEGANGDVVIVTKL